MFVNLQMLDAFNFHLIYHRIFKENNGEHLAVYFYQSCHSVHFELWTTVMSENKCLFSYYVICYVTL